MQEMYYKSTRTILEQNGLNDLTFVLPPSTVHTSLQMCKINKTSISALSLPCLLPYICNPWVLTHTTFHPAETTAGDLIAALASLTILATWLPLEHHTTASKGEKRQ